MKEPYTSMEIEVCDLTGEVRIFATKRNQWDCNGNDMVEMFKSLLLSMGYQPQTVAEVLGEETHNVE